MMSVKDVTMHNMQTIMRPTADAHTQAIVVATLARIGPASVAAIAHASGQTQTAVRRSLRVLERGRIAARSRSHGPWYLVATVVTAQAAGTIVAGDVVCVRADGSVAAATRPESHERDADLARVATEDDRASVGKKPLPWWHGNPRTRSWWERRRMKEKELRDSVQKINEKCGENEQ